MPCLCRRPLAVAVLLWLACAAGLLCGCRQGSQPTPAALGVDAGTAVPHGVQPEPQLTPGSATPQAQAAVTLTVWTTEAFSPTQVMTAGRVLAQRVAAFEVQRPDVHLRFVLKQPSGKGGVLDYLLTTATVVPNLLPDLAVLDLSELEAVVRAGLAQPLDGNLPPELVADLFPGAAQAATFDGRLYALPYQADLDHLAYNSSRVSLPPSSWTGVLSNTHRYLFPAGGQAGLVNDAFWMQYLAIEQRPFDSASDAPPLDEASLVAVLQFYRDGDSRGVFPASILTYPSADECWSAYLAGLGSLTHVSASLFRAARSGSPSSVAAPVPAISGSGIPILRGRTLVLISPDPGRRDLAVQFMVDWLAPQVNAAWSGAAGMLPTRRAALAQWDQSDRYTGLIEQQLLSAQPRPRLPNYPKVAALLQRAVEGVLGGELAPEEAAAQVIAVDP